MFKLYNIVCAVVSAKLGRSQIPVGPARTRWGGCFAAHLKYTTIVLEPQSA